MLAATAAMIGIAVASAAVVAVLVLLLYCCFRKGGNGGRGNNRNADAPAADDAHFVRIPFLGKKYNIPSIDERKFSVISALGRKISDTGSVSISNY